MAYTDFDGQIKKQNCVSKIVATFAFEDKNKTKTQLYWIENRPFACKSKMNEAKQSSALRLSLLQNCLSYCSWPVLFIEFLRWIITVNREFACICHFYSIKVYFFDFSIRNHP